MSFKFSQHVGIFDNAISKEWCDAVIKWYEDMPSNQKFQRKDYWSKDPKAGNRNSAKDLSSSLIELPPDQTELPELNQKLAEHFMSKLSNCWTEYSDKCNIFGTPFRATGFKVQKTKPSEGYHIWHSELPTVLKPDEDKEQQLEGISRFAVYTVYLNDNFTGGETEFLMQALRVPPKKGSICLFPAAYTHLHRGNPPLTGEKYILTGWLHYAEPPNENK